jgi:hypothetical protein
MATAVIDRSSVRKNRRLDLDQMGSSPDSGGVRYLVAPRLALSAAARYRRRANFLGARIKGCSSTT